MKLFHGSHLVVEKPDICRSREKLDFGRGFYTTPFYEQAVKWTERFQRRYGKRVVSIYDFNENEQKDLHILKFDEYCTEWLDFITLCRLGIGNNHNYDLVIGSVANDRVFAALEAYFNGYSDKETAIARLRFEKPNLQYCFSKQEVINRHLHYISNEVIV